MKIRSIVVVAAIVPWLAGSAVAQTKVSIAPSLSVFPYTQREMPEWDGVALYTSLQIGGGTLGTGNALGASSWFKKLDRTHYQITHYREASVTMDLDIYLDTVNETGAVLAKKANATTGKQMDTFNGKSTDAVFAMLKDYRFVRLRQSKAKAGVDAAWKEITSAMAAVDADEAVILTRDVTAEQSDLVKRKAAIMAQVKSAGWVKEAFGIVKKAVGLVSNPTKLLGYVAEIAGDKLLDASVGAIEEALLNNVLIENWQTLKEIEDRQVAITVAINGAKTTELKGRLKTSQDKLSAARLRLVQAEIDLTIASVEGWDYIDRLAALERSYKCTDLFGALQSYNYEIRRQAGAIRDHGLAYLDLLDSGAPGAAGHLLKSINRDIKEVEGLNMKTATFTAGAGGDYATWLRRAESTRGYLTKHVEWYQAERTEVMRNVGSVQTERQLLLVDSTVAKVLELLKSTTDF